MAVVGWRVFERIELFDVDFRRRAGSVTEFVLQHFDPIMCEKCLRS